jgi:long-chain acyl-CoA synthetase
MEELGTQQSPGMAIHRWDALLAEHDGAPDDVVARAGTLPRDRTACLIYTSGTGGVPKGVMLSHGAILSNTLGAERLLEELGLDDEVFLSFLPLSHSYEHTAGLFFPIRIGAQIYYAEAIDRLSANMVEVKPTLMTAVPRLYEVMHDRIRRGVRQAGGRKEKLFNKTVELGRKRYENPARLGFGERLADAVLTLLVRRKVRAGFGGRLKALVSGGAPLNYDIGLFFTALGVRLLQGYGQTESAPVISCNKPSYNRIDTVGPPMEGVELRIAEDGEILVRGELVMQGYWDNPEATSETIRDGWLHTGDIGELDSDGSLRITDRKKDIIVNSGGDNLSPQRVEGFLTLQPEIAQAMVYGDKRPHLVALIVPDAEFARRWGQENGGHDGELAHVIGDPGFRTAIGAAIDRVNAELSVIEKVRRFSMTAEPFSIENGMMTPTLKIRRHVIRDRYGKTLEALYGG